MKTNNFLLLTSLLSIILVSFSCKKITEDDINREVAYNIAKTIETATKEIVPSDYVGTYANTTSWHGGTVEINGDFSGNGIGNYTIKFTNVTFEYIHKIGKKEWKSVITQSGTLNVNQSGNIINASSNSYSSSGTVSLKNKKKNHNGSGSISIQISGNTLSANIYGTSVTI